MRQHSLTKQDIAAFEAMLIREERSAGTIAKYLRDVRAFLRFLPESGRVDKETVVAYKRQIAGAYRAASVNSMLVAINNLLRFLGWHECRVKLLRVQRQNFRQSERELTREEYLRLLRAAQQGKNERLYFLMQTICSTGLRVSEHRFVTVEAVRAGQARVRNKGKERLVFLPKELQKPLLQYCKRRGITSGPVFVTRSGRALDRSNIWADMKRLCKAANVAEGKVFPHNLRHLFALTYYRVQKDVIHLADILGHASVDTTRIYTATSGREQKRLLSRLRLVCCGTQ